MALSSLRANPTGEQVVAGQASFNRSQSGALKITQGSDRAIINWQKFSIGVGEKTTFLQPNSNSAVLNRVVSGDPSSLLGSLNANGNVFLINPNGILVGAGAQINVGSLIASTLDVPNAQFLAGGEMTFSGASTAGVTNLGTIRASTGDVMLFSRTVTNAGTISAPNGSVGLGAGSEILLKPVGDERVFVKPHPGDAGSVANSGVIQAVAAELKASGNPYALAINHTGTIEATGIQQRGGRVYLTASGGSINAGGVTRAHNADGSGGQIKITAQSQSPTDPPAKVTVTGLLDATGITGNGGSIDVTGDAVSAMAGSRIDASGAVNGGTIHFGGGEHGADPTIPNAKTAYVDQGATIAADGAVNGGNVVVWSNENTQFNGHISAASTMAPNGHGGFVEVSGKSLLAFNGTADTHAVSGQTGTLLLDPQDILITGTTILDTNVSGSTPYSPTGATSQLSYLTLSAALLLNDVTIQTGSATGPGLGNITFGANAADAFTYLPVLSNRTLTLSAAHDININAPITSLSVLGSLSVNLIANTALTGGAVNLNQPITVPFGTLTANGAAVTVSTGLNVNGLTHLVGNTINLLTPLALNTAADFTVDAAQTLNVSAALSNIGSGAITLNGASVNLNAAISTTTGALHVLATTGDLTLGIGGSLQTGGAALTLTSATGNVNMNPLATLNSGGGAISILASGNAVLSDINAGAGNVSVTAALGAITQGAGTITGAQATLNAGLGIGTALAPVTSAVATLGFTAGGDVHLLQSGAVTATGSTTANGLIDLRTTGNGALTVGATGISANGSGTVNLLAGNGSPASSANLSLGGLVQSGFGDITIGAGANGGTIINGIGGTLSTGAALTSPLLNVVTGGELTLSASGDIGATANRLNVAVGGAINTSGQANTSGLHLTALGDATLGAIGSVQTIDVLSVASSAGSNGSLTVTNPLSATNSGTISLAADLNLTVNAGLNAPGAMTLSAANGNLAINAPILGGSGAVTLTGASANIDAAVLTTTGALHAIATAGDLTLGASGSLQTSGGALALSSVAGNLSLNPLSTLSSNGGAISVTAHGNVALSDLNAGSGNVSVTATLGAITQGAGTITGTQATLNAGLGLGATLAPIATAVGDLEFTAGGDVHLLQSGAVTATGSTTANGLIDLRTTGNGTLTVGVAGISVNGSGAINLLAGDGASASSANLSLGGLVQSTSGNITLGAGATGGAIINGIGGTLLTGAALTSPLLDAVTSGNLTLNAGGDIGATANHLNVAVGGSINTSGQGAAAGLHLTGLGDVTLGTIGSAQTIDVLSVASNVGVNGSLTIANPLLAINGGTISLGADLNVAINASLGAPGAIAISAGLDPLHTGAVTIIAPVSSVGGLVAVAARGDIDLGAAGSLAAGNSGQISISTNAAVNLAAGSSVASQGGEVNIYGGANLLLNGVSAGAGNIFIQSGGAISAATGGLLNGNQVTITAAAGIGALLNPIETTALELAFQAGGDVCIHNTGSLLAAGQVTAGGSLSLQVGGGNLTIGSVTSVPAITGGLNAQGQAEVGIGMTGSGTLGIGVSGNLTINTPVLSGSGSTTVTVGGDTNISANLGSTGASVTVATGNNLTLASGGSITAPSGDINVTVDTQAGGGVGGGQVIAGAGTTISAGGTVTLTSDSPSNNSIDPSATISGGVVVNLYLDPSASGGSGSGGSGSGGSGSGGSGSGGSGSGGSGSGGSGSGDSSSGGSGSGLHGVISRFVVSTGDNTATDSAASSGAATVGANSNIADPNDLARFTEVWMQQNSNFGAGALETFMGRSNNGHSENDEDQTFAANQSFDLIFRLPSETSNTSRLQSASGFVLVVRNFSNQYLSRPVHYSIARVGAQDSAKRLKRQKTSQREPVDGIAAR